MGCIYQGAMSQLGQNRPNPCVRLTSDVLSIASRTAWRKLRATKESLTMSALTFQLGQHPSRREVPKPTHARRQKAVTPTAVSGFAGPLQEAPEHSLGGP